MTTLDTIQSLSKAMVLQPLCEATEGLLAPIRFMPNDRLEITLTSNGDAFVVQAFAERLDGTRGTASRPASEDWFARVPERRHTGYGRWTLKATDTTALIIAALWSPNKIIFSPEAHIQFEYLTTRFFQQSLNGIKKAKFKQEGVLPDAPDGFYDHPLVPLTSYQLCAHHTSIFTEGSAYFMEQGVGKTPPAIRRICHEAGHMYTREKRPLRVIIVAPRNVRSNWAKEIARFCTVPGKVVVLRGGQLNRVEQLVDAMAPDDDSQFTVVICSYETLQRSWHALRIIEWDLAIADESHYFKSPWAKRSTFMMKLRDRSNERLILTGTPMANSILDLYCQLEFLGEGMSGFSTHKAFRDFYSQYTNHEAEDGSERFIRFTNLPLLQERLARVSFMMTKKEAMPELPDKNYDIVEVQMTAKQRKVYAQVASELAAEIEADLTRAEADGRSLKITANNVLTKLLRLAQITAGIVVSDQEYDDQGIELSGERNHFITDNPKMDELMTILKEKSPTEKTIVWSCFVPVIHEIERRCKKEGIKCALYYGGTNDKERDRIEKDWNEDPTLKVFIGNPAAGGVGLNLPGYVPAHAGTELDSGCNADHTIFYACDWSYLKRSQAEDRNHGKNRNRVPIRVTDLCCLGTVDEEIRTRVRAKKDHALEVQDVKAILERLLDTSALNGD